MNDRQAVCEYLIWVGGFVCPPSLRDRYQSLFSVLTERAFTPMLFSDENRERDGINLRTRFADEHGLSRDFWVGILPEECVVLEMLIALALRMEWEFLHNNELGNRTGVWFWEMLNNIGLGDQDDLNFDEDYVQMRINILVDRTYEPNGVGGLFPLERKIPGVDMTRKDLCYQMNRYVSEKFNVGEER